MQKCNIYLFTTFRPYGTVGPGLISFSTNIPSLRDGGTRFDFVFYQHSVPTGRWDTV